MNTCPTIEERCVAEREGWDVIRRVGAPGAGFRSKRALAFAWNSDLVAPPRCCALRVHMLVRRQAAGWQAASMRARAGYHREANAMVQRMSEEQEPHTRCLPDVDRRCSVWWSRTEAFGRRAWAFCTFVPDWLWTFVVESPDGDGWYAYAQSVNPARPSVVWAGFTTPIEAIEFIEAWRARRGWEELVTTARSG